MIRAKKVARRGLSLLLTLAMLLSVVSFTAFAETPESASKSDLLIEQFAAGLTDAEKLVVKELISGQYSYTRPDPQNNEGLIVITDENTTNPTVTANSNDPWVPVEAYALITKNGTTRPVEVTVPAGSFENVELLPYSVFVTYRYSEALNDADRAAATTTITFVFIFRCSPLLQFPPAPPYTRVATLARHSPCRPCPV